MLDVDVSDVTNTLFAVIYLAKLRDKSSKGPVASTLSAAGASFLVAGALSAWFGRDRILAKYSDALTPWLFCFIQLLNIFNSYYKRYTERHEEGSPKKSLNALDCLGVGIILFVMTFVAAGIVWFCHASSGAELGTAHHGHAEQEHQDG